MKGVTDEVSNLLLAHKFCPLTGTDALVQKFCLLVSQQLMSERKQYPFSMSHWEIKLWEKACVCV